MLLINQISPTACRILCWLPKHPVFISVEDIKRELSIDLTQLRRAEQEIRNYGIRLSSQKLGPKDRELAVHPADWSFSQRVAEQFSHFYPEEVS